MPAWCPFLQLYLPMSKSPDPDGLSFHYQRRYLFESPTTGSFLRGNDRTHLRFLSHFTWGRWEATRSKRPELVVALRPSSNPVCARTWLPVQTVMLLWRIYGATFRMNSLVSWILETLLGSFDPGWGGYSRSRRVPIPPGITRTSIGLYFPPSFSTIEDESKAKRYSENVRSGTRLWLNVILTFSDRYLPPRQIYNSHLPAGLAWQGLDPTLRRAELEWYQLSPRTANKRWGCQVGQLYQATGSKGKAAYGSVPAFQVELMLLMPFLVYNSILSRTCPITKLY